jgi:hypothetical protein
VDVVWMGSVLTGVLTRVVGMDRERRRRRPQWKRKLKQSSYTRLRAEVHGLGQAYALT